MSEHDLPPLGSLDDDLRALLDAERARPPVPPHARARLLSRLEASVAASAGAAAGAALATKAGATKSWVVALTAFALGGMIGAGVTYFARRAPEPRVVTINKVIEKRVEVPVIVSVETPPPSSPPPPSVAPPTTGLAVAAQSGAPAATASPSGSANAEAERNLIDAMRAALARGDSAAALGFVADHEKRFPAGGFVETREALAVQALARAGRTAEAKARGERFRKRYPSSVFSDVVDQAIGPP